MSRGRFLSDGERDRRRAEDRDRLEQAARALLSSDGWQQWVRVRSRNGLSRYSLRNQLLIALQAPNASFVAGFHAWNDLGRTVTKGQRGIRILAPMPIRDRDETVTTKAGNGEEKVRTLFKSVAVFDVSQTELLPGRETAPLAPPSQPITSDSHAYLLDPLTTFAEHLGYRVEQRTLEGPAPGGWCDAEHNLIVVDASLPPNARVRVLVHELAHASGIGYAELGRERAEVMVDCVIFCPTRRNRGSGAGLSVGDRRYLRALAGRMRSTVMTGLLASNRRTAEAGGRVEQLAFGVLFVEVDDGSACHEALDAGAVPIGEAELPSWPRDSLDILAGGGRLVHVVRDVAHRRPPLSVEGLGEDGLRLVRPTEYALGMLEIEPV